MCGFAGIARAEPRPVSQSALARMLRTIRHRGPDEEGIFVGPQVGLAHARLSIVDIASGQQPMTSTNGQVVVVYNGEIYNHIELRRQLESMGRRFRTHCDTEVLLQGYEVWGEAVLDRLNGQFAFAIYDERDRSIFLARDRFGVRPLFYTVQNASLIFGSEIKAIMASGEVSAEPDYHGLNQVCTFWAARPPRTPFKDVWSLEPGTCARWQHGELCIRRYFEIDFTPNRYEHADAIEQLDELMRTSVSLRMRADVPVGGYLSGGLDSTITCALAADSSPHQLRTFAVTFEDPALDESRFQRSVADQLASLHNVQKIGQHEIAAVFPDVIRHTETPLVRTAPAPMFLLSRMTRDAGIKVVLTGEGADEMFLGYDLFKETVIRAFCLRQPQSTRRPLLLDRLYPYLGSGTRGGDFWRKFFLSAGSTTDPLFSHLPRFLLTSKIKDFYSADMRAAVSQIDPLEELRDELPSGFNSWSQLNRAAYLEFTTLLSPYLLSSQADRVGMAHSVEARFPFLDHRIFEFAASLPTRSKLRGLREKDILRRWAASIIPAEHASRTKQPYRSPDIPAFFAGAEVDYVQEVLTPEALRDVGIFEAAPTAALLRRCRAGLATSFRESQALVAILSTQLWHKQFCSGPTTFPPRAARTVVRT